MLRHLDGTKIPNSPCRYPLCHGQCSGKHSDHSRPSSPYSSSSSHKEFTPRSPRRLPPKIQVISVKSPKIDHAKFVQEKPKIQNIINHELPFNKKLENEINSGIFRLSYSKISNSIE